MRRYLGQQRQAQRRPELFLPLAYDPGVDAQVDWGAGQVDLAAAQRQIAADWTAVYNLLDKNDISRIKQKYTSWAN